MKLEFKILLNLLILLRKSNIMFSRALHFITFPQQWLSGRVLVSRSRGCRFKPHRCHCVVSSGIFFAILGRGPRAFQIGKISAVNHYFGKFSKQTRTAFLVTLKTKLAITHTIAIKLKENRMQF